ncbi:MAG: N-acetyltransferase [Bradyrhizobiaceae bacterium]|nr:N-acetyltransferase [Bradyrhizobiaceae bacterium]
MPEVIDNPSLRRFEMPVDGRVAFSEYQLSDGVLIVRHTEVPQELEGRGIGSRLARGVLDHARAQGWKVIARCPFVNAYMKRHPEYDDLRA